MYTNYSCLAVGPPHIQIFGPRDITYFKHSPRTKHVADILGRTQRKIKFPTIQPKIPKQNSWLSVVPY